MTRVVEQERQIHKRRLTAIPSAAGEHPAEDEQAQATHWHDGQSQDWQSQDWQSQDWQSQDWQSQDWQSQDWKWQSRAAVVTLEELERRLKLTNSERRGIRAASASGLPLSITPYYLNLCDPLDPACPIRLQCIPREEEAVHTPGDLRDPLGEEAHEVAPHLIQRYPDRVLMLVNDRCGVYCRFCTRSRIVGSGGGMRSRQALAPAFEFLRAHPEVQEVIISGGDPLLIGSSRLEALLSELGQIKSVDVVRMATRTPTTLPQRITPNLLRALKAHPCVWIMTHFNHRKELTVEAHQACSKLIDAGFPLMNQTVLLRDVNDAADSLEALFRGLIRWRVRPYYLLQMDPVRGTGHLRTPLRAGLDIMRALQGRLSGIALPRFVVDTPGGKGKVPLLPNYITAQEEGCTWLQTFRGEEVAYIDPAP